MNISVTVQWQTATWWHCHGASTSMPRGHQDSSWKAQHHFPPCAGDTWCHQWDANGTARRQCARRPFFRPRGSTARSSAGKASAAPARGVKARVQRIHESKVQPFPPLSHSLLFSFISWCCHVKSTSSDTTMIVLIIEGDEALTLRYFIFQLRVYDVVWESYTPSKQIEARRVVSASGGNASVNTSFGISDATVTSTISERLAGPSETTATVCTKTADRATRSQPFSSAYAAAPGYATEHATTEHPSPGSSTAVSTSSDFTAPGYASTMNKKK